jgi:hypothetical protein
VTPRARDYRDTPAYYGHKGAAAAVLAAAYAPRGPWAAGKRAAIAQAARRGAAHGAALRRSHAHHAPPYPVPVATWCGRSWA